MKIRCRSLDLDHLTHEELTQYIYTHTEQYIESRPKFYSESPPTRNRTLHAKLSPAHGIRTSLQIGLDLLYIVSFTLTADRTSGFATKTQTIKLAVVEAASCTVKGTFVRYRFQSRPQVYSMMP